MVFVFEYLFKKLVLEHDKLAFLELAHITYDDWPLYVIIAFSFLVSIITLEKLFDNYDLSVVYPMSQISIITASAGYMALGDPFRWSLVAGVVILFIGTFITSLSTSENNHSESLFVRLSKVPGLLWGLIFIQVLTHTLSAVVSYLGTKDTANTEYILHGLQHLHISPLSFYSAFEFNLGNQFFSTIVVISYLLIRKKYRASIFSCLINNFKTILIITIIYLVSMQTYLEAYSITSETTILLALNNFTIPITLVFAYLFLKENIGRTKVIGASLIVLGALVAVLF